MNVAQRAGRDTVVVENTGTTPVYLGGANVSTLTGLLLPAVLGASVASKPLTRYMASGHRFEEVRVRNRVEVLSWLLASGGMRRREFLMAPTYLHVLGSPFIGGGRELPFFLSGSSSTPPDTPTVSTTSFTALATIGSDVATITGGDGSTVYTLLDDASGQFEITGGNRIRLLKLGTGGSTYPITVRATNFAGRADATITMSCTAYTVAGRVAVFSADTNVTNDGSGKASSWKDTTNTYTFAQATSTARPTISAASQNGLPALTHSGAQFLTSTDPALISLLDAANLNSTVLVACAPTTWTGGPYAIIGWAAGTVIRKEIRTGTTIGDVYGDATGTSGMAFTLPATTPADGSAILFGMQNDSTAGNKERIFYGAQQTTSIATSTHTAAVTGTSVAIGRRAASAASFFNGRIFEIRIYNSALSLGEVNFEMRNMAAKWAISYPTDTYLDISGYTPTFTDDFETAQIYEPIPANDFGVMSRPWVPYYQGHRHNQYGSSGALGGETGWMIDPRDPVTAPYNPFSVSGGVLSISTRPRPAAFSALSLQNDFGTETTWLGGALSSLGTKRAGGFAQQYGYFEARIQGPASLAGNFPAWWLLSATTRWPTEIDIYEMFGAGKATTIQPVLHSDPYWPALGSVDDSLGAVPGGSYGIDDLTAGFHLLGVDVQPDTGVTFYYDRKKIGTVPPYNGVIGLTIKTAGTTVKADGGSSSGTLALKITSPFSIAGGGAKNMAATATVTAGAITAVNITQFGSAMTGVTAGDVTLVTVGGGGSLGDAVLTPVVSNDPLLPQQYNTPLYMLLNFALGSFTGTPTTSSTYKIDYVKVWKRNIAAPTFLTGTQAESAAITNQVVTNGGAAPSTATANAINDLVRQLKSWQLRFDTQPMGNTTSDWDITKLSMWDALDFLFLAGNDTFLSRINWKNPSSTTNLINVGSVSHTNLRGYSYVGGAGTYADTQFLPNGTTSGIRQDDHHLGVWLGDAVTDPVLKGIIGVDPSKMYLQVSSTSHEYRPSTSTNAGGAIQKLAPGAGHLVFTRGWRYQHQSFHNGELFHAGYNKSVAPTYNSVKIGSNATSVAGPNCRIIAAHGGRRLMPDEVAKLYELVSQYFATLGVS
jgi:hypothetical protein